MQNNDGLTTCRKQWLQVCQAVTRVLAFTWKNWKFQMEIQMVHPILFGKLQLFLGGVYMTKLAPARVLYQDDFLTVARLAQSVEHLTAERYLKVDFMLIKYTGDSKSQTLRMRYPFQSTGRPISHRNRSSFRVYMIPL